MLRHDKNAGFYWEKRYPPAEPGVVWFPQFRKQKPPVDVFVFVATGKGPEEVDYHDYEICRKAQWEYPVRCGGVGQRQWWWFEDKFYWEDEGLERNDVLALIRDRERRQSEKLRRAHDRLRLNNEARPRREPIPREMRRAVFDRDGGRCAECGSNFDLQYDHIIPVALGGATSVENLQLLCADCNRQKSDSL
jgi:5-methylcytosine-specific restriction endonuclease McrA